MTTIIKQDMSDFYDPETDCRVEGGYYIAGYDCIYVDANLNKDEQKLVVTHEILEKHLNHLISSGVLEHSKLDFIAKDIVTTLKLLKN